MVGCVCPVESWMTKRVVFYCFDHYELKHTWQLLNSFVKSWKMSPVSTTCLNGWNSTLQAAWYIRHVRIVWFLWTKPTIWLLILSFTQNIVRACSTHSWRFSILLLIIISVVLTAVVSHSNGCTHSWRFSTIKNIFSVKVEKCHLWVRPVWMVETQLCKLRCTSDTFA